MAKKQEATEDQANDTANENLDNRFVAADAGAAPRDDGMKYDPIRGTDVPNHYPAAYVVNDGEGEMVKHPRVTPDEYDDKVNPQDAKTTDSEFIVRAPNMERANELAESERSGLPEAAQEPNQ